MAPVTWWWFSHPVVSDSCDPMDYSLPGSSAHGISKARIVERFAISFSRGSSQPRDWPRLPLCRWIFFFFFFFKVDSLPTELPGKPNHSYSRKRTDLEPGGRVQFSSSSHIDHKACGIPNRESQAQDWQGPKSQVPPQGQFQLRERHSSRDSAALWLNSELDKTVEVLSNKGCKHLW